MLSKRSRRVSPQSDSLLRAGQRIGYHLGMNADAIRELVRREPFEPFEVNMTNGEVYPVRHPEQVFLAGSRMLIYYPETDRLIWCSPAHRQHRYPAARRLERFSVGWNTT